MTKRGWGARFREKRGSAPASCKEMLTMKNEWGGGPEDLRVVQRRTQTYKRGVAGRRSGSGEVGTRRGQDGWGDQGESIGQVGGELGGTKQIAKGTVLECES